MKVPHNIASEESQLSSVETDTISWKPVYILFTIVYAKDVITFAHENRIYNSIL